MSETNLVTKFCIKRVDVGPKDTESFYGGNGVFERRILLARFYDSYSDAEKVMKHLPNGLYQIDKIFSKVINL